jgi:energy-coupling factor transporter ATP-binding protein EcfA2
MIHQHFMLIPPLTVAENVVLGDERSGPMLSQRALAARVRELEERFHIGVDPDATVEDLPLGLQQRVEILKVLYRGSELLIFDEPTAVLTPQEVDELFAIVRTLRDEGKMVIFITHKLREVFAVTDRITVLRAGRNAGELVTTQTSPSGIARLMVGRELRQVPSRTPVTSSGPVLEALFTGIYAPAFWSFTIGGLLLPLVLVALPGRWPIGRACVASLLVIAGMWLKRFLIVVPGMAEPVMPWDWGQYQPTWVEITITIGSAAAIPLLLMLFFRFFPIMSVHEFEEVEGTPESKGTVLRASYGAGDE